MGKVTPQACSLNGHLLPKPFWDQLLSRVHDASFPWMSNQSLPSLVIRRLSTLISRVIINAVCGLTLPAFLLKPPCNPTRNTQSYPFTKGEDSREKGTCLASIYRHPSQRTNNEPSIFIFLENNIGDSLWTSDNNCTSCTILCKWLAKTLFLFECLAKSGWLFYITEVVQLVVDGLANILHWVGNDPNVCNQFYST